MKVLALAWLGAALVWAAPETAQQGSPAPSAAQARTEALPLLGTYWRLVALDDLKPAEQPGSREPHLVFHSAAGGVTGSDGCNSIRASFTQDGATLKIGVLMGTLMACPIPDRLDRRFREALVIARAWKVAENELTLLDADGRVLARFAPRLDR